MAGFIPSREADIVTWSANFTSKVSSAPTSYGITAPQATELTGYNTEYATTYAVSQDPDTRSPSNIVAKDSAKQQLISFIRVLARIIQAHPGTTPAQLNSLGLTVRDTDPTPIPPPAMAPVVEALSVIGRSVKARLWDASAPDNRGKPIGVSGASVFSFVGENPPEDAAQWKFEFNTSRTTIEITFPDSVANGAQVYISAFWFNNRKESGPACAAFPVVLSGGSALAA